MRSLPYFSEERLKRLLKEPGKYIMVAGSAKQESWEGPEWKHGLFTHYVLQGLGPNRLADGNNDQLVTVSELFEYVHTRVEDASRIKGAKQVPEIWQLTGNKGQLAFVYPQSSPIPPVIAPKLTPSAPPPEVVASVPTYQAPKTLNKEITGRDGTSMVLVPAGPFTMGNNDGSDDEKPPHEVELDAFYIDKYEVTTSRYGKFFQATGREKPKYWTNAVPVSQGDRPVVGVTWDDAKAYCEKYGKRLPTEAEWEKAARGTDGRKYPWGNSAPDSSRANFDRYASSWKTDLYSKRLKPVGNYEAGESPYGAYDMAGNVWEWVEDWYDENYYQNSPRENPEGPASGEYRVIRGGSWLNGSRYLRAAYRSSLHWPSGWYDGIGFRCAQDAR
jgi:formylglycine-generating enzyme required for sulfatase activity